MALEVCTYRSCPLQLAFDCKLTTTTRLEAHSAPKRENLRAVCRLIRAPHLMLELTLSYYRDALDDKGYYSIFCALFGFSSLEKSQYNRSSARSASRDKPIHRLAQCGSVLRTTVEVSVRTIKYKTLIAVIAHITDTLSVPGNDFWEPLGVDYLKALRTLLQHPPHVEHLSKDDWTQVINFCLTGIGAVDSDVTSQLSIRSSRRLPSEPIDDAESRSDSRDRENRPQAQHSSSGSSGQEDLEHCIQLLTASPVAPILEAGQKLLYGITSYLSSLRTVGNAPHSIFRALNNVLTVVMTDNIDLVQSIMLKLLPLIRKFWSSKSTALKEEMLTTLVIGKDALESLARASEGQLFTESVEKLVEQLHHSYSKLPDTDILQVDDVVVFACPSVASSIGVRCLSPRPDNVRATVNWTTLWAIAFLSKLLDRIYTSAGNNTPVAGTPSKRPRLTSRVDDILRDASSSPGPGRLCALQLVPLILSDVDIGVAQLSSSLHRLAPHILDGNASIASWTMIAISRSV